jgi:enterochelin esterase-like enzyme
VRRRALARLAGRRARRAVLAAVLGTVAFAGSAGALSAYRATRATGGVAPSGTPATSQQITCRSPALGGTLPAAVYLPAGYAPGTRRYPVVYFLHGLPAGPGSYLGSTFVATALAAPDQRAIVVVPQGARQPDSDREYLDWSPTEDWPQAIAHDLTRCVDQRYATIASRRGRVLIGLSAGGYGAFNIGLRALATFGALESWSGYFAATDPTGDHVLDLGSPQANEAATVPTGASLRRALARWPSLIAFYVGREDNRFLEVNQQFSSALSASGIAHVYLTYPGGHAMALWQPHAARWLTMALRYVARLRS